MTGPQYFDPQPSYARRYMPAMAWHDGECYILGGWDGSLYYRDVWRTLAGDPCGSWGRLKGTANPQGYTLFGARCYFGAQSFAGDLHFVGGYHPDSTGKVIRDHWSIGESGRRVSQWQTPPWEAREAYGLAANQDHMMMAGGVTYLNPDPGYHLRAFDDVWALDASGDWSLALANAPWGKRRSHGWEYLDGAWWLWGGFDSQNQLKGDLWRWDGVSAPVQMASPPARGVFFYCAANGRLWTICGYDGGTAFSSEVHSYDPTTDTWQQHNNFPGLPRAGCRALVVPGSPDQIVVVNGLGGTPGSRIWLGDVWSSTDGDNWTEETGSTLHVA